MNERIRELQSKSYLMCKQVIDDDGHVVVTPDRWFDAFAELLVKECADICTARKLTPAEFVASELREYFGVGQ